MKNNSRAAKKIIRMLLSAGVISLFIISTADYAKSGSFVFENKEPDEVFSSVTDASYQGVMAQQPMRSRQIIEEGVKVEVSGMLKKMAGGGWFLVVDQAMHELFMAPSEFVEETGISLKEGAQAMVSGFFLAEEGEMTGTIAICTIIIDGIEFHFRTEDGTPMWRGRGSGGSPRPSSL